jgi:hypothetical protein
LNLTASAGSINIANNISGANAISLTASGGGNISGAGVLGASTLNLTANTGTINSATM